MISKDGCGSVSFVGLTWNIAFSLHFVNFAFFFSKFCLFLVVLDDEPNVGFSVILHYRNK
jgi:hypothetical protein